MRKSFLQPLLFKKWGDRGQSRKSEENRVSPRILRVTTGVTSGVTLEKLGDTLAQNGSRHAFLGQNATSGLGEMPSAFPRSH